MTLEASDLRLLPKLASFCIFRSPGTWRRPSCARLGSFCIFRPRGDPALPWPGRIGFVLHICPDSTLLRSRSTRRRRTLDWVRFASLTPRVPTFCKAGPNWLRFAQSAPAGAHACRRASISGHRGQNGFVLHDCPPRPSFPGPGPPGTARNWLRFAQSAHPGPLTAPANWVRFARFAPGCRLAIAKLASFCMNLHHTGTEPKPSYLPP